MARIRPYHPRDFFDVYDICLRTGDSGGDATGKFSPDTLLGDVYAGPYVTHDPGLAWVVDEGGSAVGYIIATADTPEFSRWFARDWWPHVTARLGELASLGEGERRLIDKAGDPDRMLVDAAREYPAHLHIDLLPAAQGQGFGRRLVDQLTGELTRRQVPGLHLTAGEDNRGALAFYDRLGFSELDRADGGVTFGMRL